MNQAGLLAAFQDRGFHKEKVLQFLHTLAEVVQETLAAGEEVKIHGIGKLQVLVYPARQNRDATTGKLRITAAGRRAKLRQAKALRQALN